MFPRVGGQVDLFAVDPGLLTRPPLHAHVNLAGRVVADEHYGEPRCDASGRERLDLRAQLLLHILRDPFSVDDFSGQSPPTSFLE